MIARIYHYLDKKYTKKYYMILHKIVKLFLNVFYPLYVLVTKRKRLDEKSNIIVSFTSFPARMKRIHLVVESMLRQTKMPNKIILYLSLKQFNGYEDLPKKLKKIVKKGYLEVIFVEEDYRSHKKYYYSVKKYNNKMTIVTIDDDMIYPEDLIEIFENASNKFQNNICCLWANKISIKNGTFDSYSNWREKPIKNIPKYNVLPIGCAGVLYPINAFNNDILLNPDNFMKLCPLADDIWLKCNTTINNKKSVCLDDYKYFVYIDLIIKNNKRLCDDNVYNSKNDEQVKKIIRKYPKFVNIIVEEYKNE